MLSRDSEPPKSPAEVGAVDCSAGGLISPLLLPCLSRLGFVWLSARRHQAPQQISAQTNSIEPGTSLLANSSLVKISMPSALIEAVNANLEDEE